MDEQNQVKAIYELNQPILNTRKKVYPGRTSTMYCITKSRTFLNFFPSLLRRGADVVAYFTHKS